eukprot:2984173-Heterocapsa_arctica.AAC.1
MEGRRQFWDHFWNRDDHKADSLKAAIGRLRLLVARNGNLAWPELTSAELDDGLARIPNGSAVGLDGMGPKLLKALPVRGKTMLLEFYKVLEQLAFWPAQALHVL